MEGFLNVLKVSTIKVDKEVFGYKPKEVFGYYINLRTSVYKKAT